MIIIMILVVIIPITAPTTDTLMDDLISHDWRSLAANYLAAQIDIQDIS